ncbi:MAG: hypothetical protein K2G60_04180 [Oscillospiraceae bacterium]|nr:hypothetical protein [Oscillospiraceae bacterium]
MVEKWTSSDNNSDCNDKEVDIMPTAVKIIHDERLFAEQMREYVARLEEQAKTSKTQAKKDAVKALKETGVINNNGSSKKKIVSWE